MTIPTPSIMAKLKKPIVESIAVNVTPDEAAKVRPGFQRVVRTEAHDGVIKAKHAKPGMVVRAFLHGRPCGGERIIDTVTPSADGAIVTISFTTPHPPTEYKAAYRFFVQDLVGTPVEQVSHVPALVAYEEV